ncbi:MAG: ABC transporter substrate-binding protein [Vicinamibacterales bacterium]|nr:ABC transporter substrate-binding protein [Vicinamibacterales bacterium]
MTHRRSARASIALGWSVLVILAGGCGEPPPAPDTDPDGRGGEIIASVRSEPRTFNRFILVDSTAALVSTLLNAKLVRIDPSSDEVEPWLAEGWTASPDGLTYTITLRSDVRFSDGEPFTSTDVVFSFAAVYDDVLASPLGDSLRVGGDPLEVAAPDDRTVVVTFPTAFGPGMRLLDNLTILPSHLLEPKLREGSLASAWGLTTAPSELAGLGPFVLSQYIPGQRLIFTPNPEYWRTDEAGRPLPYLSRLTLEIVPDQNAEILRLEAGEIDFTTTEVRPEDYASIERAAAEGRLQLFDGGVGLDADFLWFNLTAARESADPARPWLRRTEFRRAVAHAVDREAFANTVYLGLADVVHGPVTPGNRAWFAPAVPGHAFDRARARALLNEIGLADRDSDGQMESAEGAEVRFTLLTQRGNTNRERAAAVLQEDLRQVGIAVDVVPLEGLALIDRIMSGDYDAAYFGVLASDTDPAVNLSFWMSSGGFHIWNPGQSVPATDWEARIDELMLQQVATRDRGERVQLFADVQAIFADQIPALYFAAPHAYFATSAGIRGAVPKLLRPHLLWNAESLYVAGVENGNPE